MNDNMKYNLQGIMNRRVTLTMHTDGISLLQVLTKGNITTDKRLLID